MKSIINFLFSSLLIIIAFASCDKMEDLPLYRNAVAPVLSASTNTVSPVASDSDKVALTLTWSFPRHATDSNNIKYTLEIDSAGKNFSNPFTRIISRSLSTTYLGKEINEMLLTREYPFNIAVDMDVRVTSSYNNNNESLPSNIVRIKMTPYKVPPKVALPTTLRLFIVGDATDFGWTNDPAPAFPAVRELTRLSETQWGGIFNLKVGGAYKLLETQGNWGTSFHMVSGGNAESGTFEKKDADPAFPSPANAGVYKLIFDFQTGRYTVTKVENTLPTELYITGDVITPNWVNTPPASAKFTYKSNGLFELSMAFTPNKNYKFLSSFGNWSPQFGGTSATGGTLGANYGAGSDPAAIPTPAVAGNYKIEVNFITGTYTVTKI